VATKCKAVLKGRGFNPLFLMNNKRQQSIQQAQAAHRATLLKSLQHRLEVARANGNEALVRLLEEEASYLG
jgi:hypothetical protein